MKVLVAGIGNVFLGDDGFGVEVVRRLAARELPEGLDAIDFGVRGHDLGFALTSGYSAAVLVDATPRGRAPGTLYVLDLDDVVLEPALDTHAMDPAKVLGLARAIGTPPRPLRLVGCEPSSFVDPYGEMTMGLSPEVEAAVDSAVSLVVSLVREMCAGAPDA